MIQGERKISRGETSPFPLLPAPMLQNVFCKLQNLQNTNLQIARCKLQLLIHIIANCKMRNSFKISKIFLP